MTDESIMEAVKNGNLDQASELFDRYHKRLYNYFVKISYDREASNDLTQNVFLRMIRYRNSYKEGNKFVSWIFQIARNVYTDHYKKNAARFSDFTDLESISQEASSQLDNMEQAEKEKTLHRSLAMLSEDQREILVMSRFQELKYDEIAKITDTTVANVKVKVHRAIKKLRDTYFELEKI